ncbi:hypothetical protein NKR23_g11509 [Pleurostoma richardsiae]|uniref:Amidoligase enzyme n=1 Tax=Pleurostoma richardsiae TaxID=41990 RepID=A0AA38VBE6_9PEZI|nr:hypothetical protein NKR23_g11509 [Pleurostoma richardsiae]
MAHPTDDSSAAASSSSEMVANPPDSQVDTSAQNVSSGCDMAHLSSCPSAVANDAFDEMTTDPPDSQADTSVQDVLSGDGKVHPSGSPSAAVSGASDELTVDPPDSQADTSTQNVSSSSPSAAASGASDETTGDPPDYQADTSAQHVSFGIELEFLMAFVQGPAKPDPESDPTGLPELLRTAAGRSPTDAVPFALREFLVAKGIPCADWNFAADQCFPDPGFEAWNIGDDPTVNENNGFRGYLWCPVEIRSPALWASSEAFAHINRVVDLLVRNFRIRVNESTGLHVHVGTGWNRMDDQTLRRLSALCWAADSVLSYIHPPCRNRNDWCASIREQSNLALGLTPDGMPDPKEEWWKNAQKDDDSHKPDIAELIGMTLSPPDGPFRREEVRFPTSRPERPLNTVRNTIDGLACLLDSEDAREAALSLTKVPGWLYRFNYNFLNLSSVQDIQPTLEFREAQGSMDPLWVTIWARICSRMVEFALRAPGEVFRDVIMKLVAGEDRCDYDVVDFLGDLSLHGEASYVEYRLLFDRHRFYTPCVVDPHKRPQISREDGFRALGLAYSL